VGKAAGAPLHRLLGGGSRIDSVRRPVVRAVGQGQQDLQQVTRRQWLLAV